MASYSDGSFGLPSIPTINSSYSNNFNDPMFGVNLANPNQVTGLGNIPTTGINGVSTIGGALGGNSNNPIDVAKSMADDTVTPTFGDSLKTMGNQLADSWGSLGVDKQIGSVLGGVNSVMSAYNGYKANKMAQDAYNFNKQMQTDNYNNQRKLTNAHLADRQATRVAQNANTATSVNDYMSKYGV